MAMLAIVMGVSLTSCSKDNNTDSGDQSSEKKLMKIVTVDESGNEMGLRFHYDNNGKLNKVQFNNGEDRTSLRTSKYSWDGNVINFKEPNSQDTFKFTIDDQFIISYEDGSISRSYLYFSDRLDKINLGWSIPAYISTIWNEDKLVEIKDVASSTTVTTITYGKTCNKGYCPIIPSMIEGSKHLLDVTDASIMGLYVAHPELFGVRTSQLPATITTTDSWGDSKSENISYEFSEDGYISKIIWEDYYYSFNLIWE